MLFVFLLFLLIYISNIYCIFICFYLLLSTFLSYHLASFLSTYFFDFFNLFSTRFLENFHIISNLTFTLFILLESTNYIVKI